MVADTESTPEGSTSPQQGSSSSPRKVVVSQAAHIGLSPHKKRIASRRDAKKKDERTTEERTYDKHEPTDAPYKLPSKDFSSVDVDVDLLRTPRTQDEDDAGVLIFVEKEQPPQREADEDTRRPAGDKDLNRRSSFSWCSCLSPSEDSVDVDEKRRPAMEKFDSITSVWSVASSNNNDDDDDDLGRVPESTWC